MKKRLFAVLLCAVMTVGSVMPAFADEVVAEDVSEEPVSDETPAEAQLSEEDIAEDEVVEALIIEDSKTEIEDSDAVIDESVLRDNEEIDEIVYEDGDEPVTSGADGGIKWSFNSETKTLTISTNLAATGEDTPGIMKNYKTEQIEIDGQKHNVIITPWVGINDCEKIVLEKGVKNVGDYAFACFGMLQAVETNEVTGIGECAFWACTSLESFSISGEKGRVSIGDTAFNACISMKSFSINAENKDVSIGEYALSNCTNLESFSINNGSDKVCIVSKAFDSCTNLKNFSISGGASNIEIGGDVFARCNLNTVIIPKSCYTDGMDTAFGITPTCYYAVKFESRGGSKVEKQDVFASETDGKYYAMRPSDPKREGYACGGWYKEAECTNAWDFDSDTVTENTTLYAKWTANKYTNTLKYNANGGTGAPENKVVTVTYPNTQRVVTVSTTKPKRTGYSFKGWYTAKSDGSKVGSTYALGSNNKTSNQSATIYAQWNVNTYTITYKLNGGKNGKNPASYKVTTSDITLKNPTRTGYTFKGWYKDSKFTKKITVIKKGSTGNKTVYAKWEANKYTIKYNANGGKGSMKSKSMTYDKKSKLTKNSFSRKGYTFLGWSTDKKATKAKYKNQAEVKNLSSKSGGTVTLYAVWKKK